MSGYSKTEPWFQEKGSDAGRFESASSPKRRPEASLMRLSLWSAAEVGYGRRLGEFVQRNLSRVPGRKFVRRYLTWLKAAWQVDEVLETAY